MFGKLSIRNIPRQIFAALEALAIVHDRSTEAEARQAIRTWVEPSIMREERNVRRKEVAERLGRLLDQVNSIRFGQKLRPSHIAKLIGEPRAEEVEDWFLGDKEPTFQQLEAIAKHLGVVAEWVQHGDNRMFLVESRRLPEAALPAVEWLLNWHNGEHITGEKVKAIHLVRELSKTGGLVIVKESELGHCRIYTTPYHVSEEIGAGGETALSHLWLTLELLYKRCTKGGSDIDVSSYLLKPADYDLLCKGNTHPLLVLHDSGDKSTWWEDIWDKKMQTEKEYWPGWNSLCARIARSIDSRPHLVEERDKIRHGEIY